MYRATDLVIETDDRFYLTRGQDYETEQLQKGLIN